MGYKHSLFRLRARARYEILRVVMCTREETGKGDTKDYVYASSIHWTQECGK